MAQVAKAQITITKLDDGYTIRLAPSAIVIPANADGTNPILTSAKTKVYLEKAGINIPLTINSLTASGCTASFSGIEVSITAISALEGSVVINFTASDGYVGSAQVSFLVSKQGESGITVLLDNETHAVPATHDGIVSTAALDTARTKILVFKGAVQLTAVASNATPTAGQFRYNVGTVTGGTATRIDNSNVKLATITSDQAIIDINIYAESLTNIYSKRMTITKIKGLNPEIVDRVENWTFEGTEEFDGSKIRAQSIVAAAIDVLNLFAQVVEATNLTVTGNSKIGPFSINSDGIFSGQLGMVWNAIKLNYNGFNWLYWDQLTNNKKASFDIGKMGSDGVITISASKNGGPTFTKGIVIDMLNGEEALEIKNGDMKIGGNIVVPSGSGTTVKQQILVGYSQSNPYNPIYKYLNIDRGIIVSITDS